jgi:CRISPR-associated protein Cas1
MINEVLYCERLLYLEWAQGEWDDNFFTVDGKVVHARVDVPGRTARKPKEQGADDEAAPPDERPYRARSVWLSSERLGITGKIDVVDGEADGRVVPVEFKRGKKPDLPEGAYLPERAQVCAQVLLLRDEGYQCEEGSIYFAGDRQRVTIAIDQALIATTLEAARRATEVTRAAEMPPPLVDSPKCNGCSLVGICLPDEVNLLREEPPAAVTPVVEEAPGELRRIVPARDDRQPLYVQEQGARLGLDGECLVVRGKETTVEVRLPNTSQVCLLGNVQVSTQAVRALLERGIPLSYFTYGGFYIGRTVGHDSKNVELRVAQHVAARDARVCLGLARGFVESKILNCRTMIRRNDAKADETVLFELKQLARKATEEIALASLLGVEGTAARTYFGAFSGMLKQEARTTAFDLDGRNRRPPRDPLNAMLSFAYSLLAKDFALALAVAGLDPLLGFYHQPRFGRPALALDLMEEFRPLVADSVVVGAVNTGVVDDRDFLFAAGACSLRPAARRRFLLAYERRMDQLVTHPVFGYRISYRRILEVQARLLGRHLLGEIPDYPAFRTR